MGTVVAIDEGNDRELMYFLVRDGGKGAGEKTSQGGQQRDERHLPTVIRFGFRYASRTLVPFWPPEAGTLVDTDFPQNASLID